MRAKIILAGQRNDLLVVAGLDHLIQRQLIFHTAKPRPASRDNFLPHLLGGGDIPESHAGIEIAARPTLAGDVAARGVLGASGKGSAPKKLRQFRQPLQAEHI